MKPKLVSIGDFAEISPLFRGEWGKKLAEIFMHFFSIDKVNALYERSCQYSGAKFAHSILKDLGIDYQIGNAYKLDQMKEGSFITVSNHPYGGLDGIMLIDLIASIRTDYKIMVNQILALVKAMERNFVTVKPRVGDLKHPTRENFNGLRETLNHLKNGHPFGFFPSGAVSKLDIFHFSIRDREWQESTMRIIKSVKVPIIPIRFFDKNSPFFYMLGLIDWRIRQLRMPCEIFNKGNKPVRLAIGNTINADQLDHFSDPKSLARFLHKIVHEMPMPDSFVSRNEIIKPLS
jgi:putative hemolysin